MSAPKYSPKFKKEAIKQVTERAHSVAEVGARLGVSSHSLCKWVKGVAPSNDEKQAAELIEAKGEILRLRAQMRRLEEEHDLLKRAARHFVKEPEGSTASRATIAIFIPWP